MGILVAAFVSLSLVIVAAGIVLARTSDAIAARTGLGRSIAGVVLLAGATSLPELSVGWSAVRIGAVDLTLGELLGSCLINLLILALLDFATRSKSGMLSRIAAAHALSAIVTILLVGTLLLGLLIPIGVQVLRLGPVSWALILIYLFGIRLIYLDQWMSAAVTETEPTMPQTLWKPLSGYLLAAAATFFAAPQLALTAELLAQQTGLGETFFGAAFVGGITSLPEFVATLTALRLGAVDLAVGNILGSNSFNIFIIAVVDLADPAPILSGASGVHAITAVAVIIVTAVVALGLLYRAEKRYWLVEPDAALVVLLVLGALYLVYTRRESLPPAGTSLTQRISETFDSCSMTPGRKAARRLAALTACSRMSQRSMMQPGRFRMDPNSAPARMVPLGPRIASTSGGRSPARSSLMTRTAMNFVGRSRQTSATPSDSMSTAMAPVLCDNSRFSSTRRTM